RGAVFGTRVDAAVQAERQSVAGRVDGIDDLVERSALVTYDVQYGAEHLALEHAQAVNLERRGRDVAAGAAAFRQHQVQELASLALHADLVTVELVLRLLVDHGTDVGRI